MESYSETVKLLDRTISLRIFEDFKGWQFDHRILVLQIIVPCMENKSVYNG